MESEKNLFPRVLKALLVLALIALLSGGAWFYRLQEQTMLRKVEEDLSAIAQLKVAQITAWREDQLEDAATMQEHPFLRRSIERFLADPGQNNRDDLSVRLQTLARQHSYADAQLVEPDGAVLLAIGEPASHHSGSVTTLNESLRGCRPVMEDLHIPDAEAPPHISVIVPFCSSGADERPDDAAVVLVNDASRFLYPLIQFWPTPSASAETLLVRRDGDHVLFLNDLRHQSGTALNLRVPLTEKNVPAVMAVDGKSGYVKGLDYRGVEVVSIIAPIPDSPWYMISKIDSAEVFAEWHYRSALIVALLLGLTVCLGTAGLVLWQRDKKAHFRTLYLSEAALRAEAERHSVTLRSIGDAVIATDAGGIVELLNPVAEALTGWRQEDARNRPLAEVFCIVNEETRNTVEDPVTKVLREGTVVGLANHTILIARDGSERPIADSGAPIRDQDGAIIGVVLVFRDQSDERAAREALLAGERRYRETLDNMLEGCQIIGPDWHYLYVNRAAARQGRKKPEELLGRNIVAIYPQIDSTPLFAAMKRCLEQRDPQRLENVFRYPDGSIGYFDLSIEPVPEGIFILSVDITERRLAQQALSKSTERTRLLTDIIEKAEQPLAVGYPDGRLGIFNKAFCTLTGYSADELVTIDWINTLTPPAWHQVEAEALTELERTGNPVRFEKEYRHKDGFLVPIELLVHAARDEAGQPQYYYAFITDITRRKQMEADQEKLRNQLFQAQKMESVGRLAGGVAHDFNNILSVILGYSEFALANVDRNDPLHDDLQEIFTAAQRSRDITRQLLAFARRETIAPEVLDLNETVENLLKMLRRLIGEDLDLAWKPRTGLAPVFMDPSQIDQILANLCINARDAISNVGTISIETAAVSFDAAYCADHAEFVPGDFIMLSVSDDGYGMDSETLDKIFEPFFTTKATGQGTGLGLATVYGIVRQNNGFINVYSEPGQGTTFRIYLPRHEGETAGTLRADSDTVPRGNDETLLVVEDERSILKLAERILSGLNYRVLTAQSPSEALQTAEDHADRIVMLITDVVMPEMNGRELAERLKTLCPNLRCLYMSGYTANVIAHRGVLDKDCQFIQKPFSTKDLAIKVRSGLDE